MKIRRESLCFFVCIFSLLAVFLFIPFQNVYAISTGTGAEEFPLGFDAGDDLNVGSGKLVVEGDTGNVGIGDSSPDSALDVESGDVRVGTGTFSNASGSPDVYVTGNLEVDGSVFLNMSLTGLSDVNSSTQGAGRILVSDGSKFNSTTVTGDVTITAAGVTDIVADAVGSSEIAASGVTGATYNAATLTVDADGRITAAASSSLTGLSDVNTATQGNGRLLVSDGTKFQSVSLLTVDNSSGKVGIGSTSPNSTLDVNGSMSFNVVAIDDDDTPYTAKATDFLIIVDATDSAITINLPAVAGNAGRVYEIKKIDASANAVTIDGSGAETIDDSTTVSISTQYQAYMIICDGTEWWII